MRARPGVLVQDYVIANMLMDVTLDPDELISEFLTAYYKEAAPFVREYMDVMHGSIADTNFCMVRGPLLFWRPG